MGGSDILCSPHRSVLPGFPPGRPCPMLRRHAGGRHVPEGTRHPAAPGAACCGALRPADGGAGAERPVRRHGRQRPALQVWPAARRPRPLPAAGRRHTQSCAGLCRRHLPAVLTWRACPAPPPRPPSTPTPPRAFHRLQQGGPAGRQSGRPCRPGQPGSHGHAAVPELCSRGGGSHLPALAPPGEGLHAAAG